MIGVHTSVLRSVSGLGGGSVWRQGWVAGRGEGAETSTHRGVGTRYTTARRRILRGRGAGRMRMVVASANSQQSPEETSLGS